MSSISKEDFAQTGLPEMVQIRLCTKFGLAYVYFSDEEPFRSNKTLADCGPGINLDLNSKDEIIGLEDISKEMFQVVKKWVEAIKLSKKQVVKKGDI